MSQKGFKSALRVSFLAGLSSFAVVWPAPLNARMQSPYEDRVAIAKDWKKVGSYLSWGIDQYEQRNRNKKRNATHT